MRQPGAGKQVGVSKTPGGLLVSAVLPHRILICPSDWDRLSAAYARLKGSTHRDKIEVLQKLSVRLSKLHLSFEVPRAQAQDAPRWHYEMEVMFGALHGLDFVHVTAGLLADHMVDRHFGVDSCDDECEGGRLCHQYASLEHRFQEKLALRVEELLDHKVFAALWDLFDEGILGAVIDVQVAISEVHVKLVGSLQLKQKFGGKWMELVDARVRALLERHTAGHSPIYRVQKMDGNSGCALLFADQHPPHFSPLARQAFGEQAAQGVHGRRRARIPFSEAQRANMQAEILKSVDKGSWSESIRSAKMRDDGEELDESSIRDVEELDSDHGSHAGGDSISVAASPTSDLSVDSLDFLSPLGSPTCTRETETTVFSEMDTLLPAMDTSDW